MSSNGKHPPLSPNHRDFAQASSGTTASVGSERVEAELLEFERRSERLGDPDQHTERLIADVVVLEQERDKREAAKHRRGKRASELAPEIRSRAREPWVSLRLGENEIARLRLGAVATLTGAPGAGKSTLAAAFMLSHVREVGAGIYVSIELDADELAARVVGMQCHASWEEALRGEVPDEAMDRALALPRLTILDGDNATLHALEAEIGETRRESPDVPILVVVDYLQIVEGDEKEVRARVAAIAQRLRRLAKHHRIVLLGISQPSRAAGRALGGGELLGADTMTAMAETAEIERAAYVTLALGAQGPLRDDGTCALDLSIGKGRMGGGDKVWPLSVDPRTGRFTVAGDSKHGADVRAERKTQRNERDVKTKALAVPTLLAGASAPMSRRDVRAEVGGDDALVRAAVNMLLADPASGVVEVEPRRNGSYRVWTRDRAQAAGCLIRSVPTQKETPQ